MPTDSTLPGKDGDEYDRFASLAKRLVNVPKSEIDEARKREQAQKG